jgi:hypothetical protein
MKRMGPDGQLPWALTMAGAASKPAPRLKAVRRVMVFFMMILPLFALVGVIIPGVWQGVSGKKSSIPAQGSFSLEGCSSIVRINSYPQLATKISANSGYLP